MIYCWWWNRAGVQMRRNRSVQQPVCLLISEENVNEEAVTIYPDTLPCGLPVYVYFSSKLTASLISKPANGVFSLVLTLSTFSLTDFLRFILLLSNVVYIMESKVFPIIILFLYFQLHKEINFIVSRE